MVLLPTKPHEFWHIGGNLYRCHNCGLDRRSYPLIGTCRPWPQSCTQRT